MRRLVIEATAFVVSLFVFWSCETVSTDDSESNEGRLMLTTEGFTSTGATKAEVWDTYVFWSNGDRVNLNGTEYEVTVTNDVIPTAYVNAGSLRNKDVPIYGYYGCSVSNGQTTSPTVTIPDKYVCSYNNSGLQVISLPMAAYSGTTGNAVQFKHLTSVIKVEVKNITEFDVILDSVVVSSATCKLSGERTLNFNASNFGLTAVEGAGSVQVSFSETVTLVSNGPAKEVQVPILPVSAGEITVKVYTHSKLHTVKGVIEGTVNTNYDFIFSYTDSNPALARNDLLVARIRIMRALGAPSKMTEVDHSLFTINGSGDKVRIAKGNLQATTTDKGTNWAWGFAAHQYDVIGNNVANTKIVGIKSVSQNGTVDLFGWNGASSDNDSYGINNNDSQYGGTDSYGTHTNPDGGLKTDWGTLIGAGWRTPSQSEWMTLMSSYFRNPVTSGLPAGGNYSTCAPFTKATVCGKQGVILFPDVYYHPDVSVTGTPDYENGKASFDSFVVASNSDWEKMEAAGAVFLPMSSSRIAATVSGERTFYWTSTSYDSNDNNQAYAVWMTSNQFSTFTSQILRYNGCCVRLIYQEPVN